MKVFFEVDCLAFSPKSFDSKEIDATTGSRKHISYNQVAFLNTDSEDREVFSLNTQQGSKEWEEKSGVLCLEIDPTGKQKIRLVSFVPKK